jgi:hypothetical protein
MLGSRPVTAWQRAEGMTAAGQFVVSVAYAIIDRLDMFKYNKSSFKDLSIRQTRIRQVRPVIANATGPALQILVSGRVHLVLVRVFEMPRYKGNLK